MSVVQVQQGTTAIDTIQTLAYPNGPLVAPDSTPSVLYMHVNGVINAAITVTVTQRQDSVPANITGYYQVSFPTSTLAVGDDVEIGIRAVIAGFTTPPVIKKFLIVNTEQTTPIIR